MTPTASIKPLGTKVIIERLDKERMGEILLPQGQQSTNELTFRIIAFNEDSVKEISVGDEVVLVSGTQIFDQPFDGRVLMYTERHNILGIVNRTPTIQSQN